MFFQLQSHLVKIRIFDCRNDFCPIVLFGNVFEAEKRYFLFVRGNNVIRFKNVK